MSSDLPVQLAGAAPETVEDPVLAAQTLIDDPTKAGTPEWLAAKQLLVDQGRGDEHAATFSDLEREMQALKGMSEI